MVEPAIPLPRVTAPAAAPGPSAEMRRFSAGIRVVTALMCTVLVLSHQPAVAEWAFVLLLGYGVWGGWLLWGEAVGSSRTRWVGVYWLDAAWAIAAMRLVAGGDMMFTVTLVHPVVLVSIGYGVRQGLLLAAFAAAGLLLDLPAGLAQRIAQGWSQGVPALMVLALVPAAALIARPMSLLRRRLALIEDVESRLDPRRGLEPIGSELVDALRTGTAADVVALVLPRALGAPALLSSSAEGSFRASDEAHAKLESLLAPMPAQAVGYVARRRLDPRRRLRVAGGGSAPPGLDESLAGLAEVLEMRSLQVVPLHRYGHCHGHFVFGYANPTAATWDAAALADTAPELLAIIEQASLVDQLQAETEGHERARIGRDLHDSAIQPYLGLKYAVETVALRIPADNPARAEVDSLAALVNGEVAALRELISTLRTGAGTGDNALVPAVRRQVRRFAVMFGIDIDLDCPEHLPTTRALAGALFHLVNEALNNVRKHTPARHAWVRLALEDGAVRLIVRDDAGSVHGHPAADFHPRSLDERVRELGGTLQIARPDGVNTEVRIIIPV